jgi:tetratricopeptide (TPR) repeat protein
MNRLQVPLADGRHRPVGFADKMSIYNRIGGHPGAMMWLPTILAKRDDWIGHVEESAASNPAEFASMVAKTMVIDDRALTRRLQLARQVLGKKEMSAFRRLAVLSIPFGEDAIRLCTGWNPASPKTRKHLAFLQSIGLLVVWPSCHEEPAGQGPRYLVPHIFFENLLSPLSAEEREGAHRLACTLYSSLGSSVDREMLLSLEWRRHCLRCGNINTAAALTSSLLRPLSTSGESYFGMDLCRALLDDPRLTPEHYPEQRALLRWWQGHLEMQRGLEDPERLRQLFLPALEALERREYRPVKSLARLGAYGPLPTAEHACVLLDMAVVDQLQGDLDASRAKVERFALIAGATGDQKAMAAAEIQLARLARAEGDYPGAMALINVSISTSEAIDNVEGLLAGLQTMLEHQLDQGQHPEALVTLDRALSVARESGCLLSLGNLHLSLARLLHREGGSSMRGGLMNHVHWGMELLSRTDLGPGARDSRRFLQDLEDQQSEVPDLPDKPDLPEVEVWDLPKSERWPYGPDFLDELWVEALEQFDDPDDLQRGLARGSPEARAVAVLEEGIAQCDRSLVASHIMLATFLRFRALEAIVGASPQGEGLKEVMNRMLHWMDRSHMAGVDSVFIQRLAEARMKLGQPFQARVLIRLAHEAEQRMNQPGRAGTLLLLAATEIQCGDRDAGLQAIDQAIGNCQELGDKKGLEAALRIKWFVERDWVRGGRN